MKVVVSEEFVRGAPADFAERAGGVEIVRVADRAERAAALADADAVICLSLRAEETVGAGRLRLVQSLLAGVDGIAPEAIPAGCALCNVYGHETAIGEWVLMAMLALTRRLLPRDRGLRDGAWSGVVEGLDRDLKGHTVGLVGLGHIGGRVAELARAFGMRVVAVTRSPSPERAAAAGVEWLGGLDELPHLLREADFAVVSLPLADDTRGLIGAAELAELGPESYLVNVGRGAVVQEDALYEALAEGGIAGAAIDVWWQYPQGGKTDGFRPASRPFWELDNVVLTPHAAGQAESTMSVRWELAAAQMRRLRDGGELENVVLQR